MAKKLQKIELLFVGIPDMAGIWQIQATADMMVGVEEYPDLPAWRKGIPIVLTTAQVTAIKNFVRDVVIPQAEATK